MDIDKIIAVVFIGRMIIDEIQNAWGNDPEDDRVQGLFKSMDVWCRQYHGMGLKRFIEEKMKAPDDIIDRVDELLMDEDWP